MQIKCKVRKLSKVMGSASRISNVHRKRVEGGSSTFKSDFTIFLYLMDLQSSKVASHVVKSDFRQTYSSNVIVVIENASKVG